MGHCKNRNFHEQLLFFLSYLFIWGRTEDLRKDPVRVLKALFELKTQLLVSLILTDD